VSTLSKEVPTASRLGLNGDVYHHAVPRSGSGLTQVLGSKTFEVLHRQGAPRLVSQGLMFREWEYKPDHVDNGRAN
jgi:hypothetical protein